MARIEEAIQWVMSGGRARRKAWASIQEYTRATPPMNYTRRWHIWKMDKINIIQGWGGQAGAQLEDNEPIRDGTNYRATDDDRMATDWELIEKDL